VIVAFPDDDIECTFEFAPSADLTADPATWVWTDLSDRLLPTPITTSWGVVVGNGTTKTGSCTGIQCLNDDGALTPFLATSPYYPYIDVGTPARLSIRTNATPYITDTFTRTSVSGWGTADNGAVWTSGSASTVSGGKGVVTQLVTNNLSVSRTPCTARDLEVLFSITPQAVATGVLYSGSAVMREDGTTNNYVRVVVAFDLLGVLRLVLVKIVGGVSTTLTTITPGITYGAGTTVTCHVILIGDRIRANVWLASGPEPEAWQLDYTLTTNLTAGSHFAIYTQLPSGNSNTLPLVTQYDDITVQQPKYPRIEGYLTDVQPKYRQQPDGSTYSYVQVSLGGIGSRLERRVADELSPLRRSMQKAAVPPLAYWPMEDKSGATSGASAFPAQPPMVPTGPVVFEFDLGETDDNIVSRYGTTALASVAAGAKLSAPVPASTSTSWTVACEADFYVPGIGGGITTMRIMEWFSPSGTFQRWALIGTTTGFIVRGYNDPAGTTTDVVSIAQIYGFLSNWAVQLSQSGGNIAVTLLHNDTSLGSGSVAGTSAPVTRVTINPDQTNVTASTNPFGIRFRVGHATVHDSLVSPLPFYGDGTYILDSQGAWAREMAHLRADRLCDEERVPLQILGDPETTGVSRLNSQQPGAFQTLLSQAVDSDSGSLLYEGDFGYVLDCRTNRINRDAGLTIDMTTYRHTGGTDPEEVLVPKLDARAPNVWTVERTNGSRATASADEAFLNRRGEVRASATLDILYDSDAAQHAAIRKHLSVDGQGANYPNASIDLAANPGLADDWLLCTVGSRIQRTNQPTIAGVGTIDQVIDGITEVITPRRAGGPGWIATCDTSPAQVWDTGIYDDTGMRMDSASTTLGVGVDGDDTVLVFSTADVGDLWGNDPSSQFTGYYGTVCSGQTNTVQWMSGAGSVAVTEGGFETGVSGWTPSGGTTSVVQSGAQAHTGQYSAQITVAGSPTSVNLTNNTLWPATVGLAYTGSAWIYCAAGISNVRVAISWYTSGAVFISSANGPTVAIPAATWTQLTVSGTAPATTANAKIVPTLLSSPANGTVVWLDDLDITLDSVLAGAGPYLQNAWVIRDPVAVKALSAGEEIHVANPAYWAL
jgi:hypothetical protein